MKHRNFNECRPVNSGAVRTGFVCPPPNEHECVSEAAAVRDALEECLEKGGDFSRYLGTRAELYLDQIEQELRYLANRNHTVALVGSIGVGKTSALCELAGLVMDSDAEPSRRPALSVSTGRTTICEVAVQKGDRFGIWVTPKSYEELEALVAELAESLLLRSGLGASSESESGTDKGLPTEVKRALHNLTKIPAHGPDKAVPVDLAELLDEFPDVEGLTETLLQRMDLPSRTAQDIWFDGSEVSEGIKWVQENFKRINYGTHPDFALPASVSIILPWCPVGDADPILEDEEAPLRISVVDTKGIDSTTIRPDLEAFIQDDRSVVLLCTRFNDAPQAELQELLARAEGAGVPWVEQKSGLVVLHRQAEPLATHDDYGDPVATAADGCAIKEAHIEGQFRENGLPVLGAVFYDAHSDDPHILRQFAVELVRGLRQIHASRLAQYCAQATRMLEQVDNGSFRLTIEQVQDIIRHTLGENAELPATNGLVYEPLLSSLETVHHSQVRAAIRRSGKYEELNYVHIVSSNQRAIAYRRLLRASKGIKDTLETIAKNPEFESALEFCDHLKEHLDQRIREAASSSQGFAQKMLLTALSNANNLWAACLSEWGRGPGYRSRVASHTRSWFQAVAQQKLIAAIEQDLQSEWSHIVTEILNLVKSNE